MITPEKRNITPEKWNITLETRNITPESKGGRGEYAKDLATYPVHASDKNPKWLCLDKFLEVNIKCLY